MPLRRARGWPLLPLLVWLLLPGPACSQPHIQGVSRKIRMLIKNAYLQLGPDHHVSGTHDETSSLIVLQRTSVAMGRVKIQGVASCLFLCMDTCGMPYASKEFWDECVFNEMMEANHYNTYSSGKYTNGRRTLYLGLNRAGEPRRVQISRGGALGKLSAYTRVLTEPVVGAGGGGRCGPSGPPRPRETGRCLRRPPGTRPQRPLARPHRPRRCRQQPCPRPRPRTRPPPHLRHHRRPRFPPNHPDESPEDEPDDEEPLLSNSEY